MPVERFTYDPARVDRFIRLPFDIYRGDAGWIPPRSGNVRRLLGAPHPFHDVAGNHHVNFLASAGGRILGRATASVNAGLRDSDGIPVGCVGFFECVDDYHAASDLLGHAVRWLREDHGLRRIWGPMDFDIWHGYRFMTEGFGRKPFLGEPYNKPWYPEFFTRYGFTVRQEWDSVEINGPEEIRRLIDRGSGRHAGVLARGYRFVPFGSGNRAEETTTLHRLVEQSFGEFLGFTPISARGFEEVFALKSHALDPRLLLIVRDERDEPVGFLGAYPDLSDAVRSMGGEDGLLARMRFFRRRRTDRAVFYFGGITPAQERRRAGAGRAGFTEVLRRALGFGYRDITVALMASDSKARAFTAGLPDRGRRRYALFRMDA